MSKPDVTLQPSKGIISEAAARIYAGYIAAGHVKDDNAEVWIKRSIREAIIIAKTVDASVESHDAIAADDSATFRPTMDSAVPDRSSRKPPGPKEAKPRKAKETIEELAEEVLMDEASQDEAVEFELDEESDDPKDAS